MQTIKINIVDKVATAEGNPFIVCGNSDYTILFNFDKAWDGYNAKTARFSYEQDGEEIIAEVPFAGNSCKAPVIQNSKRVDIGVYAGDILSTTRCRVNCRASILDGEGIEHEEPPEDVYNQMIDICNEAVTAASEATAAAEGFEATTRETFANAIKGELYGAAVRADDVSPVEHIIDVKVKSKNLIPYPYANSNGTSKGVTFTIDTSDKGVTLNGNATDNTSFALATNTSQQLKIIKGRKYTLSCISSFKASSGYVYVQNFVNDKAVEVFSVVQGTITFTPTETGYAHIGIVAVNGATFNNEKVYVQLEEGTTATEYTPYVDPSTAKVTRCGKNLFDKSAVVNMAIGKEPEATKATILEAENYRGYYIECKEGEVFSISRKTASSNRFKYAFTAEEPAKGVEVFHQSATPSNYDDILKYENIITPAGTKFLFLYLSNEADAIDGIQIETGSSATEYETYKGEIYTPNADGTVEGITSLSPTMTLLTDTPGTIINCEYNKDTNKALTGNMVTAEGTVVSQNADFAEVAEWADGNPDNEDRTGYFVCANVPVDGIVMKKATSTDDVKGVSIQAPAFAGNYTKDKLDSNGKLLPKYSYVAIIGIVPVIDNGTCEVGGRCMPDDNGCAIPSSNSMGYQVVNRIDENRVLIIIEPNGDMVQRIKTKINDMQKDIENLENVLVDILSAIQSGNLDNQTVNEIEQLIVSYLENKTIMEVER